MRRKDREVTDIEKIKEILDACKVSRIGLMDQGKVYIVPMNHGYSLEDGRLVPVSYTHLDVYKRQIQSSVPAGGSLHASGICAGRPAETL